MHEIIANIHMHTVYSDGTRKHSEIVQEALTSDLDVIITTDHNVWVTDLEGYYENEEKRILLLVGEEVHDQAREPQKNHLLVLNNKRELAQFATNTQELLDAIKSDDGLAFIAHPIDPAAPAINEGDLSWVDWDVQGFTGLELWNAMTEMKSLIKTKLHAIYYVFNPKRVARGPFQKTINLWDELLRKGKRVVAIGGSDAHAFKHNLGPIERIVFPFTFHFQGINTHLLLDSPLSGDLVADKVKIYKALAKGHAFIGYDLPASTRGFRFSAHGKDRVVTMGDEVSAKFGVTFQIQLPFSTECRLLRDGQTVKTWKKREICTHITAEPGVYRVEVYIDYKGRQRGWIFSNPIYVVN